ncbi:beta-galactosidase [Alkalibacterium putridalgicola]|uniref:Beta-galactosidase n=1 Tax=Alkalibacterium putridalgicola TaxID=426703 RepID=A0A1H7U2N5_9LACT|nr:glycoside hydrolase family 2 TIM barrel-domain containing protein [Alkalibacterium putridalgicola]GEK89496.1 beta-galactosidase [Alkalibacterium putridalgicola]SEL91074.1 beta-galactosidase [Alkalibacterium putridalgicola]
MRQILSLNKDWKFTKESVDTNNPENASGWTAVSVPHTWNAVDGANGFDFYRGACWYEKTLSLPIEKKDQRVFIEFEGSNSVTNVYINGHHLGEHRGGYSTFRFDLTEHFTFGEDNTLLVEVDNSAFEDVYPLMADFTFYGGLYRDVNLVLTNPVHVDVLDHGSQGVYIKQQDVSDNEASFEVETGLTNDLTEDRKVRLWIDILDQEGRVVNSRAKDIQMEANSKKTVTVPFKLNDPVLWNGIENPYHYTAKVSVQKFNDTIDELTIPFGLRYFHVDPQKGFFLNGKRVQLNGVSRHQDRKDMGWAITEKEHKEDMELIKEVGATSIRLAHYQHDQTFYDLCDQEGMVVWAEIPFISRMSKTDLEGTNAISQMTELIRQNYNHPSIIFWGVQNEIQIGGESQEVRDVVKKLTELTKKEDPSRLTTLANVMFVDDEDDYNYMTDVVGYNKYYGWYMGETEDFGPWMDTFHEKNPETPLCISEYGAEGIIEYHTDEPKVKDYTEEYHALYHEKVWKMYSERPYLWATYVWNMFDFGANIRDEGGVKGRNNKGLITYDRKLKKDAFYMYKANWTTEKFVHLTGKRYIERVGDETTFKVYTNCDSVTLVVDGKEIETKEAVDHKVVFENVALNDDETFVKVVGDDGYTDQGVFEKVSELPEYYKAPDSEEGGLVSNWFSMPEDEEDLEDSDEDVVITDDVYSSRDKISDLMENNEIKAVLSKFFGDMEASPMYEMMSGMSLDMLASMDEETLNPKLLNRLNRQLTKISKK